MKKLAITLALLAGLAPAVALVPPAHADRYTPGCAEPHEYKRIKSGMSVPLVKQLVGDRGHISYHYITPDYTHITLEFKLCVGDGSMDIEFYKYERGRLKVEDKGWYQY